VSEQGKGNNIQTMQLHCICFIWWSAHYWRVCYYVILS